MNNLRHLSFAIFFGAMTWLSSDLSAQGFLDQLGRQLQREISRAVPGNSRVAPGNPSTVPGNSRTGPSNQTAPGIQNDSNFQGQAQGFGIPNESGRQNNSGGNFDSGGFFDSSPGRTAPRVISPNPRPLPNQPRQVVPQPSIQSRTAPSSTTPSSQERSSIPPVRATNVSNEEFKIRCPPSFGRSISYRLESSNSQYPYTIQPGYAQSVVESRVWFIRYASGSGDVRYRLRGGNTYEFAIDSDGLVQLYQQDDEAPEPPRRSPLQGG